MLTQLRFIKLVAWDDVFSVWKANEGSDPVWQEFATKEKGFDSWEAWRGHQTSLFRAPEREWKLYELSDPNLLVPTFRIGPFQGWQKHFEEKNVHTFEDLVRDHRVWVQENVGVKARREQFPGGTQFIGLYFEDSGAIVLYEGHHRAAAIALAIAEGNPIVFTKPPTIALASIPGDGSTLLRHLLESKTDKTL